MRSGRLPKSPAFQVYAPDALSDEALAALSPAAYGFFWKLLLFAWVNVGLADDLKIAASLCGVSLTEHEADLTAALQLFPVGKGGRRFNARQERERAFQAEGRAKRIAAGKLGVDARKQCSTNAQPSGPALVTPPYPDTRSPTPDTRDPTPGEKKSAPRSPRSDPQAKAMEHFQGEWARTRCGTAYDPQTADWVTLASRLKKPGGDLDEIKRRMTRALEHPAKFWVESCTVSKVCGSGWNDLAVSITATNGIGAETPLDRAMRRQGLKL